MMDYHEQQIVSLRLAYMGGFTKPFQKKVAWLLAQGFTADELYSRCVDDWMKQWRRIHSREATRVLRLYEKELGI